MTATAVFRTEASPRTGAGHAVRCLALADALYEIGWRCAFAVNDQAVATLGRMASKRHRWVVMSDDLLANPDIVREHLAPSGCDLLVVDSYAIDAAFERGSRAWAGRILAIDDLANRLHDCDMLLDATLGRQASAYTAFVPATCTLLLGAHFAPLRPNFARLRMAGLKRGADGAVRRVLVNLGATDPDGVTQVVLEGLSQCGLDLGIEVMLGATAPGLDAVRRLVRNMPMDARLIVGTSDPAIIMSEADLVIGAAGSSAWERCCLGLPTLLVQTADNQRDNVRALVDAGAAVLVGDGGVLGAAPVIEAVRAIAADPARLAPMSRAAGAVCDGLGARRTAMAIAPVCARGGGTVALRPMQRADGPEILDWQRHPETRRYFRDTRVPDPTTHAAWLDTRLANARSLTEIIEHDGHAAGLLQLDPQADAVEVSILVGSDHRGCGIGHAALVVARRLLPETVLVANVQPENMASQALFTAAGYRPGRAGHYRCPPTHQVGSTLQLALATGT